MSRHLPLALVPVLALLALPFVGSVPTELVIFPDENHWVLKPQNSVQWYQVVKSWLDRWTGAAPAAAAAK